MLEIEVRFNYTRNIYHYRGVTNGSVIHTYREFKGLFQECLVFQKSGREYVLPWCTIGSYTITRGDS